MNAAAGNYPPTTTAPRWDNTAASTADAPRASTAFEDIQNRLRNIRDNAAKLADRVYSAANRAQGAQPQPGAAPNGVKAPQAIQGAVQDTFDLLNEVDSLIAGAHEQVSRIERVV